MFVYKYISFELFGENGIRSSYIGLCGTRVTGPLSACDEGPVTRIHPSKIIAACHARLIL